MTRMLIGPVLNDIHALNLTRGKPVIATAFYTAGPLQQLKITSKKVVFAVRLDRDDLSDWISGSIDPAALAQKARHLTDQGTQVELAIGKFAHAKFYVGSEAALIGSANLTTRGLAGLGHEAMSHFSLKSPAQASVRAGISRYMAGLQRIKLDELESFVAENLEIVCAKRKKQNYPNLESRPPKIVQSDRPDRLGTYNEFLNWLKNVNSEAAIEILARANGKNNLSGHIYRNFFGLRQYLLYAPDTQRRFAKESEDDYRLSKDPDTESEIRGFVLNHASDEDNFSLETWKTYLPQECGGRAEKHGGTIGNLNRMLPLVAKQLAQKLRRSR
jgi:hypothetical protein